MQRFLGHRARPRTPSPGLLEGTTQDGTVVLDSDDEIAAGPAVPAEGQAGPSNWQQQQHAQEDEPANEDFGAMNGHLNGHPHHQQLNGNIDGAGQQEAEQGAMDGHPAQPNQANGSRVAPLSSTLNRNVGEHFPDLADFLPPEVPLRNGHVPSPPVTSPTSLPSVTEQLRTQLYHWVGTQDAESALTMDGGRDLDLSQLPPLPPSVDDPDQTVPGRLPAGQMNGLAALQPVANGVVQSNGGIATAGSINSTSANGARRTNGINGASRHESSASSSSHDALEREGTERDPAGEDDNGDE